MDKAISPTSHDANENLLTTSNIAIFKGSLTGRTVLGYAGLGTKRFDPVDVFLVQSILTKPPNIVNRNIFIEIRPTLGYIKSVISRIFEGSWATHWAIEVDGDYYELDRLEPYRWPFWRASIVVRDVEGDIKDGLRQILRKVRIGATWMNEAEIAAQGMKYALEPRFYSLFGDNCQQFILNFCEDIDVAFDHAALEHLISAPHLLKYSICGIWTLGVALVVDIMFNKGRFVLPRPSIPILGLCVLSAMTLAHPRMYTARLHRLPFTISHTLYLGHSGLVWILYVIFCAWIWGHTGYTWIFGVAFIGATYHSTYSVFFVDGS